MIHSIQSSERRLLTSYRSVRTSFLQTFSSIGRGNPRPIEVFLAVARKSMISDPSSRAPMRGTPLFQRSYQGSRPVAQA